MVTAFATTMLAEACTGTIGGERREADSTEGDCGPALIARRIWKLTPEQHEASLAHALGTEAAEGAALALASSLTLEDRAFRNESDALDMSEAHVDRLFRVAEAAAATLSDSREDVAACLAAPGQLDETCASSFVRSWGRRAFRRPLTNEEVERYSRRFQRWAEEDGIGVATERLMVGMLMSPLFMYRTELGPPEADAQPGPVHLTAYETASALSYLITNGPPDDDLLAKAEAGKLAPGADLRAAAEGLLNDPTGGDGVRQFYREYLGYDAIDKVGKDTEHHPSFDESLASAMKEETDLFVSSVLWGPTPTLRELLTANYSVINQPLAGLYGLDDVEGHEFRRVELGPPRAGILTQPSVMGVLARNKDSDIVIRGKFMREKLLCAGVPPPPADVNAVLPEPDEGLTQRQHLESVHLVDGCIACHELLDPFGYPFESFDAIGAIRTHDRGLAIDTTGQVRGTSADFSYDAADDFIHQLVELDEVAPCFASHLIQYVEGIRLGPAVECLSEDMGVKGSDLDLRQAMLALVSHPSFTVRK
ncbi:MAG: DUF1592 domain-containing protein [Myxococcota bacterium]